MKKLLTAALLAFLSLGMAHADVVLNAENFPDPNFRACVSTATGVTEGGTITEAIIAQQVKWITGFDQQNISDITGLEHFYALEQLSLANNNLSKLDISKNQNLTRISCASNKLEHIDLSKNPNLTGILCSHNLLTSIDVGNNPNLTDLRFHDNQITSVDISNCPQITKLYCAQNPIKSLDLSGNPNLQDFRCYESLLTTLDLSKNPELTILHCWDSPITEINVKNCHKLQKLCCYRNLLTSIDISDNPELVEFRCHQNQISSIKVSHCTKLEILTINENNISSIDLSNNIALKELYCAFNQLTSLDVSKNINLQQLRFNSNNVSSIDVSNNTKLTTLETNHNKLTSLDISKNTSLKMLTAGHNLLTYINISGLKSLAHFCVGFNKNLKDIIGLSECTELKQLYVNDCNFYTLDLSSNTKLETLHLQNNHLIQYNGSPITLTNLIPHDISYFHNDEYDGYGWGGTNQTRTMPATRENVDADGTGVKEWFVVKMPVDAAVPDGLGKKETFVNDASKKLNVVEIETQGVYSKVIDGVTYFYLPIDNAPEKFSFTYSINKLTNKNCGYYTTSDATANNVKTYIGFDGITIPALLQVIITPRYPSATFWMDGEYRSTFIPGQKLNTYKNTIALDGVFDQGDKTYDGNTYTISRKAANGDDETTVATVTLHLVEPTDAEAYYTYTVAYPNGSWAANTNQENRWDNVPTVNNGVVTDGIKVCDYFAASTTDGGDKAGTYTYSVKEDHFANNFVVPVYAATTTVTLVTDHSAWKADQNVVGYTLDEINSEDEDHHVLNLPKGVAAEHSEFYNTTFKYHSLYRYGNIVEKFIIGRNETLSLPYYLEFGEQGEASNELRYVYGMHVISPYGENSYGTNEVVVPKAIITIEPTDLVKSEYTFHEGSRYYSCLLNLGFMQSVDAFTTQSGGYRVWRNCDSEDEEYTELLGRANDYMFYKNMDLTSHAAEVKEVGSQQLSVTNASGSVFPYTSGTFGSSATTPKASFLARAYYKASPKSSAANMKKAPATTYYYVAEALMDVEWDNVVTGVSDVADKQVSSVRYYDLAGHSSTKPFCGVNIVVTKYTDGSSVSAKILR